MIPTLIVFGYLAVVLYIGIFAFRRGRQTEEDFFLASRSLKEAVFLLSLFGTNMTAVAILGSSGLAYNRGIGVYGMMGSASGLVIPLTLFVIGTRLWWLGKRFGHMTQAQFFRDRWESPITGTAVFVLTAAMLVPYIIVGVMGGGATLEAISTTVQPDGTRVAWVSYEVGGAIVAIVVMSYVFFGGMRGTAWVNTLQTVLFLGFGFAAFFLIARKLGGFEQIYTDLAASPKTAALLTRERIPKEEFFSYFFIPLSTIMFPHIAIMCMTAEKVTHFRKTVVIYPLAIMAIWLPCVYLGIVGAHEVPGLKGGEANSVLLRLLSMHSGELTSGVLGAGIMACVMASDSQILALCTMFTEDIFAYYGGRKRYGAVVTVWVGRAFIVLIGVTSYVIAMKLKAQEGIFELAVRFAFSGFAALSPVMLAALFWKRSTKAGALASTLFVAAAMLFQWWLYDSTMAIAPRPGQPPVVIFPALGALFLRTPGNVTIANFLPVLPMVLVSGLLMIVVSLASKAPSKETIERYFPSGARPSTASSPRPSTASRQGPRDSAQDDVGDGGSEGVSGGVSDGAGGAA